MKDYVAVCVLHTDIFPDASDETDKIFGTNNFDGKGKKE
jgi:hypothetical protein